MAGDAPVFIIAAARFGSSPLRLILTGHAPLYNPPETWLRQPLVREVPWRGLPTQAQMEHATGIMVRHKRWPNPGIAMDGLGWPVAALTRAALQKQAEREPWSTEPCC